MPQATISMRAIFWPRVVDAESARKAANAGFSAAAIVAAVTCLVVVVGMLGKEPAGPDALGPWALLDVAAFAGIAWGIRRLSRTAAVLGLLLFLAERVYAFSTGAQTGSVIAVLLALWFLHGVRGTFAFHRYHAASVASAPGSSG